MAQTNPQRAERPTWTFPDRLVKARKHAGLTGEQLAERLEMSLKTLQRYEGGRAKPKRGVTLGWAMACGIDPNWLEQGDPEPGDRAISEGTTGRKSNRQWRDNRLFVGTPSRSLKIAA